LINGCVESGKVRITTHAEKELAKDRLDPEDALLVLRLGTISQPEHEHGEWRYRIQKAIPGEPGTVWIVVAFDVDDEGNVVVIVTGWRKT
jgi:hypothetical protein